MMETFEVHSLYDDNIDEDKDWLSLWGDQKSL